ncbi:MAG: 50S ribosomal protein L4 [Candidatus Humimicrobiaceae bacterium]|jgi:large subunit ribosomal protein L4|nr:50S ribosomal protein L4 [Actinomycetota bacterium]MDY0027867.1 50S ribosomal protein L4 [Candidatus Humimicrobiaceae bacterium]
MGSLSVINIDDGTELEKIKIPDELVKKEINSEVLYYEVKRYLASVRTGTHKTKDRSEVRGGGKKPWRQKGTGNARAGSIRSPLWKGGGVVFGPVPRDYSFKLNKKVIKQSRLMALSEKYKDKKIIVIDELKFEKPATKKAEMVLRKLNLDKSKKILIVFDNLDNNEVKSFRNIRNVMIESVRGLNTYIMLVADYIIFTRSSLNDFIERFK